MGRRHPRQAGVDGLQGRGHQPGCVGEQQQGQTPRRHPPAAPPVPRRSIQQAPAGPRPSPRPACRSPGLTTRGGRRPCRAPKATRLASATVSTRPRRRQTQRRPRRPRQPVQLGRAGQPAASSHPAGSSRAKGQQGRAEGGGRPGPHRRQRRAAEIAPAAAGGAVAPGRPAQPLHPQQHAAGPAAPGRGAPPPRRASRPTRREPRRWSGSAGPGRTRAVVGQGPPSGQATPAATAGRARGRAT